MIALMKFAMFERGWSLLCLLELTMVWDSVTNINTLTIINDWTHHVIKRHWNTVLMKICLLSIFSVRIDWEAPAWAGSPHLTRHTVKRYISDHHDHHYDHDHHYHDDHHHHEQDVDDNRKLQARDVPETRRARNRTMTINPATSNSSKTITVMFMMIMIMIKMIDMMMELISNSTDTLFSCIDGMFEDSYDIGNEFLLIIMMKIIVIMLRTTTLIMLHTVVLEDKLIKKLLVASLNFFIGSKRFFIGLKVFFLLA